MLSNQLSFFDDEVTTPEPVIVVDFGNKTLSSVKLAISSVIFTWMLRGDNRIFNMAGIKKNWTPKEIYEYMRNEDKDCLKWISFDNINESEL